MSASVCYQDSDANAVASIEATEADDSVVFFIAFALAKVA